MTLEKLQEYCLSLPGTTEGIKWEEHLCFMVCGKIFCITDITEEGKTAFKIDPEDFDEITEQENITQAYHLAKRKWVSVNKRNAIRPKEWEAFIQQSYQLVKAKLPKKLQKELEG